MGINVEQIVKPFVEVMQTMVDKLDEMIDLMVEIRDELRMKNEDNE